MTSEAIQKLRSAEKTYHLGWGDLEYTSWQDEQMSWKTTCNLGDWSFLPDLEVRGPEALRLFTDTSVNSFAEFPIGRAKHTIQCNEDGKVITEGILMRIAEDAFRVQVSPAPAFAVMAEVGDYDFSACPINTFQLQIAGPKAVPLLDELCGAQIKDVPFMRFREVEIAGEKVVLWTI